VLDVFEYLGRNVEGAAATFETKKTSRLQKEECRNTFEAMGGKSNDRLFVFQAQHLGGGRGVTKQKRSASLTLGEKTQKGGWVGLFRKERS